MPERDRAHPLLPALLPALALALAITLARVVYLIFFCDYQLVEDEAHYWLWSRSLDWSYYSKGPGVALAIAASTHFLGNAEWAVRLPTALLSGAGLIAVALLLFNMSAFTLSQRERAASSLPSASPSRVALAAVLSILFAPAIQAVSILMTIDGPYIACWAAACLFAWIAFTRTSRDAWIALGVALALGFVFKYTTLLLVPGLVAFAILARKRIPALASQRLNIFICTLVASLGLLPVLIWNAQHDWVTVKHLLGHLGLKGGDVPHSASPTAPADQWSPFWSLELIGQQLGMIGPILVLSLIAAISAIRRRPRAAPLDSSASHRWTAELFLICAAAPILLFYLAVSLIAEPEGNWPMAAYVTLLPLGAWRAADALSSARAARQANQPRPREARPLRWLWRASIWYALIAMLLVHFAGSIAISLNRLAQTQPVRSAFNSLFHHDPRPIVLGRLYGAREMARDLDKQLQSLEFDVTKPQPFILAQHYGRASQMAYYFHSDPLIQLSLNLRKHPRPEPEVFCAMPQTGGRKSQFDLWPHTSLSRPDLAGRSAIILSNDRPETLAVWNRMFESVELIPKKQLAGEHKPDRFAYIGRGYRPEASATAEPAAQRKDAP